MSLLSIIFIVCMYNWYYMFNSTTITQAYTNINSSGITKERSSKTFLDPKDLLILSNSIIRYLYRT